MVADWFRAVIATGLQKLLALRGGHTARGRHRRHRRGVAGGDLEQRLPVG